MSFYFTVNTLISRLWGEFNVDKISEVVVKKGGVVSPEDIILVLESEKASMEIPAEVSGEIKDVMVKTGEEVVTGTGRSVLEIIEDLDKNYPGLKDRICETDGKVRRFVNIFVNEEDIRFLENLQTSISDEDELSIIPAIAGG